MFSCPSDYMTLNIVRVRIFWTSNIFIIIVFPYTHNTGAVTGTEPGVEFYTLPFIEINHAYQSLACETAINADFSELFSLKRIYVKYKNAILSLIDCFFRSRKD